MSLRCAHALLHIYIVCITAGTLRAHCTDTAHALHGRGRAAALPLLSMLRLTPTLTRCPPQRPPGRSPQRAPHPEQVHLLEQRIAAGGLTAPELIQLRNALAALIVALA